MKSLIGQKLGDVKRSVLFRLGEPFRLESMFNDEQLYRIYHASFADFLAKQVDLRNYSEFGCNCHWRKNRTGKAGKMSNPYLVCSDRELRALPTQWLLAEQWEKAGSLLMTLISQRQRLGEQVLMKYYKITRRRCIFCQRTIVGWKVEGSK